MNAEILSTFSYTDEEATAFPYIHQYRERVRKELESSRSQVTEYGYALAGLFLTYRACNHCGVAMTTRDNEIAFPEDSLHRKRLIQFQNLTGCELVDVSDYLRLTRITLVTHVSLFLRIASPASVLMRIAKLPYEPLMQRLEPRVESCLRVLFALQLIGVASCVAFSRLDRSERHLMPFGDAAMELFGSLAVGFYFGLPIGPIALGVILLLHRSEVSGETFIWSGIAEFLLVIATLIAILPACM